MKKYGSILLSILLLLSLCACKGERDEESRYEELPAPEKPVIYLYPEKVTDVTVQLDYITGDLTCTYPAYEGGWTVTAAPDGTLTDANGQTYSYLNCQQEL